MRAVAFAVSQMNLEFFHELLFTCTDFASSLELSLLDFGFRT